MGMIDAARLQTDLDRMARKVADAQRLHEVMESLLQELTAEVERVTRDAGLSPQLSLPMDSSASEVARVTATSVSGGQG